MGPDPSSNRLAAATRSNGLDVTDASKAQPAGPIKKSALFVSGIQALVGGGGRVGNEVARCLSESPRPDLSSRGSSRASPTWPSGYRVFQQGARTDKWRITGCLL